MHFTLADLVADITQNSAESGADTVELEIRETFSQNLSEFRFIAKDNGKGMDKAELSRAVDPFVTDGVKHPGRKIGLGLPFLIQTAEQSGGGWDIKSNKADFEPDKAVPGTAVEAWFDLGNVDTPPPGDIPGLFRTVLMFTGPNEIIIRRSRKGEDDLDYEIRKTELADILGDLEDVSSLVLLGKYLRSLEGEE
jgi:hypothetical protein